MSRSTVLTIGNSRYRDHVEMLVFSLRNTGYRGEIAVLTEDDNFCVAGCTMHRMRVRDYGQKVFSDNRWLQFDVDLPFHIGDRVLYLDADTVALKGCPIKRLLDKDFAASAVPNIGGWSKLMPHIDNIMGGIGRGPFYIASPFSFVVTPMVRRFFSECRLYCFLSVGLSKGTMIPFNLACRRVMAPEIVGEDKVLYWTDVECDTPEAALTRQASLKRGKWFIHYGGHLYKQVAELEYQRLHHHPEIEYLPRIQPFDQFYL